MFEALFTYPKVLGRHQEGPWAEARERYLKHCAGKGAARSTLLRNARELLVIAERIGVQTTTPQASNWLADIGPVISGDGAALTPQDFLRSYSFKSQALGCASLAAWKSRGVSLVPSPLKLRISLLTCAMNAVYRR